MRDLGRTARALSIALLAATLVAGCATERMAWEKTGVAPAERERDENACLRAALANERGQLLAPYCLDRDVYVRCMESRGYTVRSR